MATFTCNTKDCPQAGVTCDHGAVDYTDAMCSSCKTMVKAD